MVDGLRTFVSGSDIAGKPRSVAFWVPAPVRDWQVHAPSLVLFGFPSMLESRYQSQFVWYCDSALRGSAGCRGDSNAGCRISTR
jgi:hypothetical protein